MEEGLSSAAAVKELKEGFHRSLCMMGSPLGCSAWILAGQCYFPPLFCEWRMIELIVSCNLRG